MSYLKIIFTVFFLLFFFHTVFNQKLDSLIRISETTVNSKDKEDLYNTISKKYSYINIDSARIFAEIACKEAVSADFTQGEILTLQKNF